MAFKVKKRGRPNVSTKERSVTNPLIKPKGNWEAVRFDRKKQMLFYKKFD